MNYDQLEEQFYLLSQKVSQLEKENNTLSLRNTELEAQNIVLENDLNKKSALSEDLYQRFNDEHSKAIGLKVQLDEAKKKLEEDNKPDRFTLVQSAIEEDARVLQLARNYRDFAHLPQVPKYSIHKPMEEYAYGDFQPKSIILNVSDIFGFQEEFSPNDFAKQFHVYSKSGDKIFRYSSKQSMFDLERREDFAVVLNQMIDQLKTSIAHHYAKQDKFN